MESEEICYQLVRENIILKKAVLSGLEWKNVIKAITYEIILGMGLGGLIVLLVTGEWSSVTQITLTYTAIKLIMYYIYDKLWNKIENK